MGNGLHDDSAALRAADAAAGSSFLYFPVGVYRLSSSLTLTKPVVMGEAARRGGGRGGGGGIGGTQHHTQQHWQHWASCSFPLMRDCLPAPSLSPAGAATRFLINGGVTLRLAAQPRRPPMRDDAMFSGDGEELGVNKQAVHLHSAACQGAASCNWGGPPRLVDTWAAPTHVTLFCNHHRHQPCPLNLLSLLAAGKVLFAGEGIEVYPMWWKSLARSGERWGGGGGGGGLAVPTGRGGAATCSNAPRRACMCMPLQRAPPPLPITRSLLSAPPTPQRPLPCKRRWTAAWKCGASCCRSVRLRGNSVLSCAHALLERPLAAA